MYREYGIVVVGVLFFFSCFASFLFVSRCVSAVSPDVVSNATRGSRRGARTADIPGAPEASGRQQRHRAEGGVRHHGGLLSGEAAWAIFYSYSMYRGISFTSNSITS